MYVEGIPSFHVAATEKSLAFLKQKIIGIRSQHRYFRSLGNSLFDDLGFEDIPINSSYVNAEEGFLIGEDPVLDEIRICDVLPERKLAEGKFNVHTCTFSFHFFTRSARKRTPPA